MPANSCDMWRVFIIKKAYCHSILPKISGIDIDSEENIHTLLDTFKYCYKAKNTNK